MVEIEVKLSNKESGLIESKEILVNKVPLQKLSKTDLLKLWKVLSRYVEIKLINDSSLSKDKANPYYFKDLLETFILYNGKYKKDIIKEEVNTSYYFRIYSFWDDVKYFFKDLFNKEDKKEK